MNMWRAALTTSLMTLAACRSPDAPPVPPPVEGTTGVRAAALKVDLESQLVSWDPRDGTVELTLLVSGFLPKYGRGDEARSTDGHIVLKPGEKLTLRDHHFRREYTFRSATETALELDYFYAGDRRGGEGREVDSGRIVLTRGLMESGFQESWRRCSTTPQCTIIPTYCGGYASVGGGGGEALAGLFYRKLGARKECSGKAKPAPVAACIESRCQPDPG